MFRQPLTNARSNHQPEVTWPVKGPHACGWLAARSMHGCPSSPNTHLHLALAANIVDFGTWLMQIAVSMPLEAGYPNTAGFRKVVKATILVKKKPGMSDADFIEHYNHRHAQMAAPVLLKHRVITYSLTYCLKRDRQIMGDMLHGKAAMLDYDAICTFVFHDYRDFARFMYDVESKNLTPDHDNFMVEDEMRMMVGDEYMVIEDGKQVG